MAVVKGNQPKLYQAVKQQFIAQETCSKVNKGHGRIDSRKVSIMRSQLNLPGWLSVKTIIKIESQRQTRYKSESETRYYISALIETASSFYQRIRGYWGVENKVP